MTPEGSVDAVLLQKFQILRVIKKISCFIYIIRLYTYQQSRQLLRLVAHWYDLQFRSAVSLNLGESPFCCAAR